MKLLFDQNISFRILRYLPGEFADSTSVKPEGLLNAADIEIWNYAKKHGFLIVTQDSDFNDLALVEGHPPKVIWIRLGNLKTEEITNVLIKHFNDIEKFIQDPDHSCFEII